MNLYEQYENSKTGDDDIKIKTINDIIKQHPKIIQYLYNRIDTCFGKHIVYVVHMKVDGTDMIKIGYTKNTVKERFSENRWSGRSKLEIIEVLRENTLPGRGAVDFETKLKTECLPYIINSNLKLPGKNEFMCFDYINDILTKYDNLYPNYQNIIGVKPPN